MTWNLPQVSRRHYYSGGIMSRLPKVIFLILLSLFLFSCGKHDLLRPDLPLETGLRFTEEKLPLDAGEYIYRQTCEVENDKSETLRFAYKITTLKAEPLPGFTIDAEGWLIFAGSEIWTAKSQLSFDFLSQEGKIQDLITGVQVKIKHADGFIEELASCFKSSRLIGSLIEVPFSNGAEVSAGVEFIMRESIGDIYVDGMYAHHFMYRLNTLNEALEVIQPGSWYSSIDRPDIRIAQLSPQSSPALAFNAPGTFTQFESYVVSRGGIEQAEPVSVYFRVQEGKQPVALIYPQTFVGLGQYHYRIFRDGFLDPQNLIPTNGDKHSCELWASDSQQWSHEGIYSEDFKLHLRWGYKGQYGYLGHTGNWGYTNNPQDPELNHVLNPDGTNYHSKITAFWLRLDENPFPVQTQFFSSEPVTAADGTLWLRVANFNDNSRHTILPNLGSGQHIIELKVEDLQGTLSDTVQMKFNLASYKAPLQRSGILVINGGPNTPQFSVDDFYSSVTPTVWGAVDQLDLYEMAYPMKISPVKLQNYRAVLLHSDNSGYGMSIQYQVDAFDIYLGNQGNLIWSGTNQMSNSLHELYQYSSDFLISRFGINNPDAVSYLFNGNFFINAIGLQGLDDIPLNLNTPFDAIVEARQGLAWVTMFDPSLNLNWLYAFGCKPVNHPTYPPSQEQYDLYSSKYVAYKYENNGSHVVLFGFPLSYMEEAPVANALNVLLGDILGNSVAQRRNK